MGAICVGLPDLKPLARARDAAAGKMAAIGTVNPRPGGLVNNSIQSVKRAVARALNWFVRDQVIFNRQMVTCIGACIDTIAEVNRTIHLLAGQANNELQKVRAETEPLRTEARALRSKTSELMDLAAHWARWREEWQLKLHRNEVEFLKTVSDLSLAYQQKFNYLDAAVQRHETLLKEQFEERIKALDDAYQKTARELEAACQQTAVRIEAGANTTVTNLERSFRETLTTAESSYEMAAREQGHQFERRAEKLEQDIAAAMRNQIEALAAESRDQARDFEKLLGTSMADIQKQFYADLERIRAEYERVIHAELRIVRQRLSAPAATSPQPAPAASLPLAFDYARFADRFRGPEEYVTESQRFYVPYFKGRRHILDLGCGRGEFLKLMRDAGTPARGIEASEESVAYCRSQGLDAVRADVFPYLAEHAEASLDGILCSQVVEHIAPERLPELIRLCAGRLATGGVLAIETPNPECLAIFATNFYLDPTHTRPVPSQLLAFYMEECGLGRIAVHQRAPAVESIPELRDFPEPVRTRLFNGQDYAIIAYKL